MRRYVVLVLSLLAGFLIGAYASSVPTQPTAAAKIAASNTGSPTYLPVLNSDVFLQPGQVPEHKGVFLDALEYARPEAVFENYGELTNLVEAAMDSVYAGEQTAEEALNEVQRKAESLF